MALTRRAHQLIRDHFADKDKGHAVDATCGNGHDTAFLLDCGFKKVTAFDVQQSAIDATRQRLGPDALSRITLILDGHEHITQHLSEQLACVVFNLGYLPHADKSITTLADTSLLALQAATELLLPHGMISLLCYPGHESGKHETAKIQSWLNALNSEWVVQTHLSRSPKPEAPILYTLTRAAT